MPVPVENCSVPELHFMYLAKTGWPHPNPVPKGYFMGMVPHVSSHVPFIGVLCAVAKTVRTKGSKSRMLMKSHAVGVSDIGEGFGNSLEVHKHEI